MSPVSRRILIYWLLLLLPTCAVGIGAVQLLRREQARLVEQEDYASESRRAAITARAGLIVENAELLVGDLQNALMDALATMPAENLPAELGAWTRTNPLVRVAFRARVDGTLLHAVAVEDEEASAFRRRVTTAWRASPPWASAGSESEETLTLDAFSVTAREEASERRDREEVARSRATANVAKVQSARRDAQLLARSSERAAPSAASGVRAALPSSGETEKAAPVEKRRGWTPTTQDGRLQVFGWIERGHDVVGLELELGALISRLAAALPDGTGPHEGFALVDDRGRILQQVGFVPRDGASLSAIPLSSAVLRGWEVVAYYDVPAGRRGGATFFLLGSLLVGILLVAILVGGSLLFWQARRSEAEAAQKTSFVANVSHEFKTPLTTIRLYAELLENGRVPDAERRGEYLRTIARETQRLARLVGNALDFSRLEQGRKKFVRETCDLRELLARLVETHALRLQEAGMVVKTELPEGPQSIATDRDAVEQIVVNLLDNAAKYGASGGEVTLRLERAGSGGARISVLDRGPGVPVAHRERIFEKFHRVDDTLTAEHGGAGLGLSIARQLARGLGGELRYTPREGGGAAFILELP